MKNKKLQRTSCKYKGSQRYYRSLQATKMDNLEEMDKFLEKDYLPRLNQDEIEKTNGPITST